MIRQPIKTGLVAATALFLAACGSEAEDLTEAGTADRSGDLIAEVIGDVAPLSTAAGAFERTGLKGVLEGEAAYTVLAPTDEAFQSLGAGAAAALEDEERGAVVAAILREHMVPGALTPEAIRTAITDSDGDVAMATFGAGDLTFMLDGDSIVVFNDSGQSAKLGSHAVVGKNGVLIPLEGVLVDPAALENVADDQ